MEIINNKDYQNLESENKRLRMDNKGLIEENDRLKKLMDYVKVNMKNLSNTQ
jgi:hypothetical protein